MIESLVRSTVARCVVLVCTIASPMPAHAQDDAARRLLPRPDARQNDTPAQRPKWYAGTWDATLYRYSDPIHPRTVGLRIEVVNDQTHLPISGAIVTLRGGYVQEQLGIIDDPSIPRQQEKEWTLTARTGNDGIVVFSLRWQKEYPWSLERPRIENRSGWDHARTWQRPIDDVEKVRAIDIRAEGYAAVSGQLDFGRLLDFGQDKSGGDMQPVDVFPQFDAAWRAEIGRPGLVFCVLRLGDSFPDFANRNSVQAGFFEHIRQKAYGIVYQEPRPNLTSLSLKEFCGPYFVYLHRAELESIRPEVSVDLEQGHERRSRRESKTNASGHIEPDIDSTSATSASVSSTTKPNEKKDASPKPEDAKPSEDDVILRNEARQSRLGIAGVTLTDQVRIDWGLPVGVRGVAVLYVESGSPAAGAGIRAHTVIDAVLHRSIADEAALDDHIDEKDKGTQLPCSFWRKTRDGSWEHVERILTLSQ